MELKINDKVKHILSGQKMTIEKLNGSVAKCILEIPIFYPATKFFKDHYNYVVICQTKNLILLDSRNISNNQLKLFNK